MGRLSYFSVPLPTMPKYYQFITDLPLRHFISCAVDGNLSALTIEGFPDESELIQAWVNIQQQYADAIGDLEQRLFWDLYKEVSQLHIDMVAVNTCCEQLSEWHNALCDLPLSQPEQAAILIYLSELKDSLNKTLNSTFELDPTKESFHDEIKKALRKGKAFHLLYNIKNANLDEMKKKFEGGEKPTKEYYMSILMTLSKNEGYKLTIDTETVFEFCERIRRFNKSNQWQSKNA